MYIATAHTIMHIYKFIGANMSEDANFCIVAQLWAKSVGAVRLRALPFFLVRQGCLRVGVSRCGPAAVVGRGC